MKKFLFALLLLLGFAVSSQAASYSATLAAGKVNAWSGGSTLYNLTIAASNNVAYVYLIDAPSTSLTFTNAAWVSKSQYSTNQVVTYTNAFGVTENWTNTVLYTLVTTNSAGSQNYNAVSTIIMPANTTTVLEFPTPLALMHGLLVTNTGVVTVTATYSK